MGPMKRDSGDLQGRCYGFLSPAVIKYSNLKQPRKGKIYNPRSQSVAEGRQRGSSRQACLPVHISLTPTKRLTSQPENTAGAMENAACWLACSQVQASANFPTQPGITCPGMVPLRVGGALLHQLTGKRIPHRQAGGTVWSGQFLSWGLTFSGDSRLCRVDSYD